MLIGLSVDDTSADLDYMVRKLLSVRVFDSNQGPSPSAPVASAVPAEEPPARMWAKSVVDIGGEILCGIYFVLQGGFVCRDHGSDSSTANILLVYAYAT